MPKCPHCGYRSDADSFYYAHAGDIDVRSGKGLVGCPDCDAVLGGFMFNTSEPY